MKYLSVCLTIFLLTNLAYECQGAGPVQSIFTVNRYSSETKRDPDVQTIETIQRAGYPAESHSVETEDGYILTIHRIPYGKDEESHGATRSRPVFLQHGIMGSSVDFFLLSTGDALPFLLADKGFDVWLGNIRGTTYSQRHTTFLPTQNEFWNYTWHEAAVYDLPAMFEYVSYTTSSDTLAYIGYSMGSTMLLVLASSKSDIASKIDVAMLMAPIAYSSNVKSPLLRFLAPLSKSGPMLSGVIASGEFMLNHYILQMFSRHFCALPVFDEMFCRRHIFLVFGADYTQYNPATVAKILNHYPAGFSAKALNHYAQLIKSGKFQQYDYGKKLNYKQYGTPYPPDYDLTKITVPTYIYVGRKDFLAAIEDVNHTANYMGSAVKGFTIVKQPVFSHLDFLAGVDVRNLLYEPLIKDMLIALKEDE